MTTYVGVNDRFKEEVAKNTRKTKEALELIQLATQQYNTNEMFVLENTNTITIPANIYHSVSYVVISGLANITEGGTLFSNAPQGHSGETTATTLLSNSIVFTGLETGTKIVIKTIR